VHFIFLIDMIDDDVFFFTKKRKIFFDKTNIKN
jgi:hypothetical protein